MQSTLRAVVVSILGALALTVSASRPATAGENLGRTVEKPRVGYSLRILEDWTEIPLPPGEQRLIGRFMADKSGAFVGARLEVLRWPLAAKDDAPEAMGKPDAPKPDPAPKPATPKPDDPKPDVPKPEPKPIGVLALIKATGSDSGKGKPFETSGGVKGTSWEFESQMGKTLAVSFRTERFEYGLVYSAQGRAFDKDFRSAFVRSARTFRIVDVPSEAGGASSTVPGLSNRETLRQAKHLLVEGIPGWYWIDTENYVILSDSPDKEQVRRLASQIEKIRDLYQELFPPVGTVTAVSVVRICATMEEYLRYGGPFGTAGYWNDCTEELVFFGRAPNQSKRKSKKNAFSVLYHEAFHQYIYYAIGEVAPHSWYNEGQGDYFAGAVPAGDKFTIQPFDWRVPAVKRSEAANRLVPLKKFVYLSQADYYKNGRENYAQGWAFIYFLRKVAKNPRWKQIPDVYFEYLKGHLNPEARTTPKVPRPETDPPPGEPVPPTDGSAPLPKEGGSGPQPDPDTPGQGKGGEGDGEEEEALPPPPAAKGSAADAAQHEKVLKAAVDRAFEGIDWDALEKEFRSFIRRL